MTKDNFEKSPVYKKHKNCEMEVVRGEWGPHKAKLVCVKHKKHIQWLSVENANLFSVSRSTT